ncbi:MAG: class I SAM-dependent methyltransferase [Acidimicrobiales bacterium]|nr:class I SAM-dependent methyltransferase [Acidimicrobiales bacterium]MCB1245977.1 class I SAM-dependent methyltransferase [Acidimicrobiia bacterium]
MNTNFVCPPFISEVTASQFRRESFFRAYQDRFLDIVGPNCRGRVVEIGGELHYNLGRFFPNADSFEVTNVARDFTSFLDATDMHFEDGSQDAFLCASVLQHVRNVPAAFSEMARTLRPGGTLVLVVPLLYPLHDEVDYWRFTDQVIKAHLEPDFEILTMTRLGGRISTLAQFLQRPVGKWNRRYLPMKLIGLMFSAIFGRFDQPDDSPLGFGVFAVRK